MTKLQIVSLFNDTNVDVLASMVTNMVYVIDALARFGVLQFGSTGSYSQELSVSILNMEEVINSTRNWRLHADCLEKLSCLANCIRNKHNLFKKLIEFRGLVPIKRRQAFCGLY